MKFLPLIWAGLWRRKGRTALNLLSIIAAFTLFGTLQGVSFLLSMGSTKFDANRLLVIDRDSGVMPIAYQERIRQLPDIVSIDFRNYFNGMYQKMPQTATGFAIDPHNFFNTSTEFEASPQAISALTSTRQGMLADVRLMQKYDWRIGQRIVLKSLIDPTSGDGAGNWTFDIVGTFNLKDNPPYEPFLFNNDYFDHGRIIDKGTVSNFDVTIDDPAKAAAVSQAIDDIFANAPAETLTQPLYAYVQDQIKKIGDIQYIIHAVLGAVFFALLVSIGTVMMRSLQDRMAELAVLKALGFSDPQVAILLYVENSILILAGAGLGMIAARLMLPVVAEEIHTVFPSLPPLTIGEALGIAVAFIIIIGVLPVRRAMQMQISDALNQR